MGYFDYKNFGAYYPQYNIQNPYQYGGNGFQFLDAAASSQPVAPAIPMTGAGTQTSKTPTISLTPTQEKTAKTLILDDVKKQSETGIASALAFPTVIGGVQVANKLRKAPTVMDSTKMFFALDEGTGTAKYLNLYKEYPDLMVEAQESIQKLERKYNKFIMAEKNDVVRKQLESDVKYFKDMMQESLNSGDPGKLKAVTNDIKAANNASLGRFYNLKTLGRKFSQEGIEKSSKARAVLSDKMKHTAQMRNASAKAAAAAENKVYTETVKKGTINSFKHNFGGKMAVGGAGLMIGLSLYSDLDKIKQAGMIDEANAKDPNKKNTHLKRDQIIASATKAGISTGVFMTADAATKVALKRCLGKASGKIAGKLAGKAVGKAVGRAAGFGIGKLLGGAIGSLIPGIGTVVGLAVGCVADWAINKYVMPHIIGSDDKVTEYQVENMKPEELLAYYREQKANGVKLDANAEKFLKDNENIQLVA